jgi:hypothetical protein
MREKYQHIYLDMSAAIAGLEDLELPEIKLVEKRFALCFAGWETVKRHTKAFDTEFEEIDFFRNIKPSFTGQIDYCKILGEAILFSPTNSSLLWSYWNNELGRYARFRDHHRPFAEYYESGSRENDPQYFLTRYYKPGKEQQVNIYDMDTAFCTPADHLVASLHALDLYKEYVSAKLRQLAQDFKRDANTEIN